MNIALPLDFDRRMKNPTMIIAATVATDIAIPATIRGSVHTLTESISLSSENANAGAGAGAGAAEEV